MLPTISLTPCQHYQSNRHWLIEENKRDKYKRKAYRCQPQHFSNQHFENMIWAKLITKDKKIMSVRRMDMQYAFMLSMHMGGWREPHLHISTPAAFKDNVHQWCQEVFKMVRCADVSLTSGWLNPVEQIPTEHMVRLIHLCKNSIEFITSEYWSTPLIHTI